MPVIFYGSNAYAMICFAKLASKWPELMKSWEDVERNLPLLTKRVINKGQLAFKIQMISTVVIVTSLCNNWNKNERKKSLPFLLYVTGEHLLSIAAEFTKHHTCRSIEDPIKRLIVAQLPHVFSYISYSPVKGMIAKIINILATFMWSYTDLFLMIISVGLSSLFRQINESLMLNKNKVSTVLSFIEMIFLKWVSLSLLLSLGCHCP